MKNSLSLKILFGMVLLLFGSEIEAQKIDELKVQLKYIQLPFKKLPDDVKTYSITVKPFTTSLGNSVGGSDDFVLPGYHRVEANADLEITITPISELSFSERAANPDKYDRGNPAIIERESSYKENKDSPEIKFLYYTLEYTYTSPLVSYKGVSRSGVVIEEGTLGGGQKTEDFGHVSAYGKELAQKAHRSGSSVRAAFYERKNSLLSGHERSELDTYISSAKYRFYDYCLTVDYNKDIEIKYVSKDKTHNYDDLIQAKDFFAEGVGYITTDRIEKINKLIQPDYEKRQATFKKAVEIWEKAMEEYNPEDRKARIDDKVARHVYYNLSATYILMNDFAKAKEYLQGRKIEKGGLFKNMFAGLKKLAAMEDDWERRYMANQWRKILLVNDEPFDENAIVAAPVTNNQNKTNTTTAKTTTTSVNTKTNSIANTGTANLNAGKSGSKIDLNQLINKKWYFVDGKSSAMGYIVHLGEFILPCVADNYTLYLATGVFKLNEGATKCEASSLQERAGTWKWNTAKNGIISTIDGVSSELKFVELTATSLMHEYSDEGGVSVQSILSTTPVKGNANAANLTANMNQTSTTENTAESTENTDIVSKDQLEKGKLELDKLTYRPWKLEEIRAEKAKGPFYSKSNIIVFFPSGIYNVYATSDESKLKGNSLENGTWKIKEIDEYKYLTWNGNSKNVMSGSMGEIALKVLSEKELILEGGGNFLSFQIASKIPETGEIRGIADKLELAMNAGDNALENFKPDIKFEGEPAKIYVYRPKNLVGMGKNTSYALYLNDRPIEIIDNGSRVLCKIYSEGKIIIRTPINEGNTFGDLKKALAGTGYAAMLNPVAGAGVGALFLANSITGATKKFSDKDDELVIEKGKSYFYKVDSKFGGLKKIENEIEAKNDFNNEKSFGTQVIEFTESLNELIPGLSLAEELINQKEEYLKKQKGK